jgi:Tfp pilus assembly protein PilX
MKRQNKYESGIVSIFVTMLLIVIMSLLVMAFAQLSRREQSESLDTQLSTQAFYAAETGVNDAKSAITTYMNANPGADLPVRSQCNDAVDYPELNTNGVLSNADDVKYTCVTIDPTPSYLAVQLQNDSQVLSVKSEDGNPIGSLNFTWTGATNGAPVSTANCAKHAEFPQADTYNCAFGGIRLDIVPGNTLSRAALLNNNMAAFLMPRSNPAGGGNTPYAANGGPIVDAVGCASGTCSANITGLGSNTYYMRLSRLYLDSNVQIKMTGNRSFKDSQAVIDSTGKAQDVLRRVLVSVPLKASGNGTIPGSALISGDSICKRFRLSPDGYFNINSFIDGDGGNPLCQQVGSGSPVGGPSCNKGTDIVLVADSSSSMLNPWSPKPTREAELKFVATTFARNVFTNADNRVALVNFNDTATTLTSPVFVSSTQSVTSALNKITNQYGTNFITALQTAKSVLNNSNTGNTRKAIIFISDGDPDRGGNKATILAETNNIKNSGVTIYTIFISDDATSTLMKDMSSDPVNDYRNAKTTSSFETYFGQILGNSFPCS